VSETVSTPQDEEQPTKSERAKRGRTPPVTGAMLFPELVWKHFWWRQDSLQKPSRNGARARHGAAQAAANGRRAQQSENAYHTTLGRFQHAEGQIVDAYWCWSEASAVVLTERPRKGLIRHSSRIRLHRASDWVTTEVPRVADLLHRYDSLAIKVSEILTPTPKRIAMEWIFAEESYLLGFVERTGRKPDEAELNEVVKHHEEELKRIEDYYDRAGGKAARIYYFLGMMMGTLLLLALGAGVAVPLILFAGVDPGDASVRNFFSSYAGGALGAVVSVMTRMRHEKADEKGFRIDYEVGKGPLYLLGGFRPFIGAIFGTAVYFALQSSFVQLNPQNPDQAFYFFALMAFLAGFSERFTHVILGQAEKTVTSAGGGGGGGGSGGTAE